MTGMTAGTRRAGYFAEQQHGGREAETERQGVQSRNPHFNCSPETLQRIRRQREAQACAKWFRWYKRQGVR